MDNSFYGQLNVFQTIAQEGSISAAARKLKIAVPFFETAGTENRCAAVPPHNA